MRPFGPGRMPLGAARATQRRLLSADPRAAVFLRPGPEAGLSFRVAAAIRMGHNVPRRGALWMGLGACVVAPVPSVAFDG